MMNASQDDGGHRGDEQTESKASSEQCWREVEDMRLRTRELEGPDETGHCRCDHDEPERQDTGAEAVGEPITDAAADRAPNREGQRRQASVERAEPQTRLQVD